MAGSTFGNYFKIMTWGESHGKGIGVVVDGCPAGLTMNEDMIQTYLDRRKPGSNAYGTPRKEGDKVTILSGMMDGRTTGTSISMMVLNESQRSSDYSEIASYYRPGHADYTYDMKYGFRDYRGGGRSSGRETIGRVAAGAVAIASRLALHPSGAKRRKPFPQSANPGNGSRMPPTSSMSCRPDLPDSRRRNNAGTSSRNRNGGVDQII